MGTGGSTALRSPEGRGGFGVHPGVSDGLSWANEEGLDYLDVGYSALERSLERAGLGSSLTSAYSKKT